MSDWTFDDIPDQSGRTAIVTGANAGIGLETARMLAQKGARVVLACRNPEKGARALESVRTSAPKATVELAALDLSDLASVEAFAAAVLRDHPRLDLLIDNAGVMVPPQGRTTQGFELQFGTNHLGHFALAGRLLPALLRTPGARVVTVSSGAHRFGRLDFDDPNGERKRYDAWAAYGQSKLANLMFALELHRRLTAAGADVRSTAAHPGWTATDLQRTSWFARTMNPLLAMDAHHGALPTLRAATDPAAASGTYWGPNWLFEMRGAPVPAQIGAHARDEAAARRLWELSERLTGVTYAWTP